jgi:hypothetical protein
MDGLQINQKIRFGYEKAAAKLGEPYALYRSAIPFTPIAFGNLIGTLPMVPSQDWTWMKANRPGNAIWFVCVDGQDSSLPLSATEGDYFLGDKTFFILSKEYQLPMQAVECNKLINVLRPYQATTPGYTSGNYAGYQETQATVIMQNMPISMLINKQGSRAESKLPTDTLQPTWTCLMPNLGNVDVRTGDMVVGLSDIDSLAAMPGIVATDDRFVISATEETEFGWRLTCSQMMN